MGSFLISGVIKDGWGVRLVEVDSEESEPFREEGGFPKPAFEQIDNRGSFLMASSTSTMLTSVGGPPNLS